MNILGEFRVHPCPDWLAGFGIRRKRGHAFDGIDSELIQESGNVASDFVLAVQAFTARLRSALLETLQTHRHNSIQILFQGFRLPQLRN